MLYLRTKLPQKSANVGKYTSHMDPMGKYALGVQRPLNKWSFQKQWTIIHVQVPGLLNQVFPKAIESSPWESKGPTIYFINNSKGLLF